MMIKNQKGQATIEAILIATILLSSSLFIMNQLRQRQVLSKLVQRPWAYIGGMIENGVWDLPERGVQVHPNHLDRHATPQGDAI